MTELGATFPDVAQFLSEANAQHNLAGRLEIDALPRAGRFFDRSRIPTDDGKTERGKKRVGSENSAPNLFQMEIGKKAKTDDDDVTDRASIEPDPNSKKKSRRGNSDKSAFAVTVKPLKNDTSDDADAPAATDANASADASSASKSADGKSTSASKTASGKTQPASTEPIDDPDTPAAPPPTKTNSFWHFFSFGSDSVSGNKEP